MTETLLIYRCPHCGKVAEGWKAGPRYCGGSQWMMETQWDGGFDHPSTEMERLSVQVIP
jgi:hypothetical protein